VRGYIFCRSIFLQERMDPPGLEFFWHCQFALLCTVIPPSTTFKTVEEANAFFSFAVEYSQRLTFVVGLVSSCRSHWSLLAIWPGRNRAESYDSMSRSSSNNVITQELTNRMSVLLGVPLELFVMPCPQQANGKFVVMFLMFSCLTSSKYDLRLEKRL